MKHYEEAGEGGHARSGSMPGICCGEASGAPYRASSGRVGPSLAHAQHMEQFRLCECPALVFGYSLTATLRGRDGRNDGKICVYVLFRVYNCCTQYSVSRRPYGDILDAP